MRHVLVLLAACSSEPAGAPSAQRPLAPNWSVEVPNALENLPKQKMVTTETFATSENCMPCHDAGEKTLLRDAKGRSVAPVSLWRTSMMAMAVRDPFYLATVARERQSHGEIDAGCIACHAPAAEVEKRVQGAHMSLDEVVHGTGNLSELAREGVGCSLCHQIASDGLGSFASFGAGFSIGSERKIYGPFESPRIDAMQLMVNYTPTQAAHITESSLCATCHTVFTKPLDVAGNSGALFAEQTPYLEWQNSDYSTERGTKGGAGCRDCHMPSVDDDGNVIDSPISVFPSSLATRTPHGRHGFFGANVAMLRIFAENTEWTGSLASKDEFALAAVRTEVNLRRAASLDVSPLRRAGTSVEFSVRIDNLSGHKFPTGYPSRRAWLHVRVQNPAGATAFESGGWDSFGRLQDDTGALLEGMVLPHLDRIERSRDVVVYESVPGTTAGKIAHLPLEAATYLKDSRLLPKGATQTHRNAAFMKSIGTERDTNFGSSDTVSVRVPASAGSKILVELVYQTYRPTDVEALSHPQKLSAEASAFFGMVRRSPPVPVVVAHSVTDVQ